MTDLLLDGQLHRALLVISFECIRFAYKVRWSVRRPKASANICGDRSMRFHFPTFSTFSPQDTSNCI